MKHAIFIQQGKAGLGIAQVAFMKLRKKGVRMIAVVRYKKVFDKYFNKGRIPVVGAGFDFYHVYFRDIPFNELSQMDFPDNVLPVCVYTNKDLLIEYLDAAEIIICCRGLTSLSEFLDMMHQFADRNKTIYLCENDYHPVDQFKKSHGKNLRLKFIKCMVDRVCTSIEYLDDKIIAKADPLFNMIINEPEDQSIISSSGEGWPNVLFISNEEEFMAMWERKRLCVNYPHFYLALLAYEKAREKGFNAHNVTDMKSFLDEKDFNDIYVLAVALFAFWYFRNRRILMGKYGESKTIFAAAKDFFSYFEQSIERISETEDSIQRILKMDQPEAFKRKSVLMMDLQLFAFLKYLKPDDIINDLLTKAGVEKQVDMNKLPYILENLEKTIKCIIV